MDPLSITASAIAVLQLTGTVVSAAYTYRQSVKNASKEAAHIIQDLTGLSEVLEQLLKLINDNGNVVSAGGGSDGDGVGQQQQQQTSSRLTTLEALNKPGGPLETCHDTLKRLNDKLSQSKPQKQGWRAIRQALVWPLKQEHMQKALTDINAAKATISFALLVDQTSLIQQTNDNVKILTAEYGAHNIDEAMAKKISKISPIDPTVSHFEACRKRQKNTCGWFLRTTAYDTWLNAENQILWVSGIPGCGKTILCSAVIEHLVDKYQSATAQTAVAYYYFNFQSTAEQQFSNLLRALIAQLFTQCTDIPDTVSRFVWKHPDSTSNEHLAEMLASLIDTFKQTYLVIDAFDECAQSEEALRWVRDLSSIKDQSLHMLISSRQDFQFHDTLETASLSVVSLDENVLANDIEAYIRQKLDTDAKLKRWPANTKSDIERSLKADAGGLFRWVDCQLDRLRKCLRPGEVETVLRTPPKTLDDMYDRIIANIDEAHIKDAYKVLQWVTFATRPLRMIELNDALAFDESDSDQPVFAAHLRLAFLEDVLYLCSSLIRSSGNSSDESSEPSNESLEVRLAHKSVRDYLVSRQECMTASVTFAMNVEFANSVLAQCCLVYLLQFNSTLDMETLGKFPLAQYAAQSWMQHYTDVGESNSSSVDRLAQQLLSNTTTYHNCCRLYNPERHWQGVNLNTKHKPTQLYYASLAGLSRIVSALLSAGADPNVSDHGDLGCALSAAAYRAHIDCVQALLRAGANADGPAVFNGIYGSPIAAAAAQGHFAIVEELVRAGASLESKDHFEYGSALWEALNYGQVPMAKMLLSKGANPNVAIGYSGVTYAIDLACELGDRELICMMLSGVHDRFVEDILSEMITQKDRPFFEMYLERDRSERGRKFGLEYAARGGYSDLVQRLLAEETQEDGERHRHTLAFEQAASSGSLETVQILYESRPENGVSAEELSTGVLRAASLGHTLIVIYLLDRGADVNSQICRNALVDAAGAGHLSTVQALLSADISAATVSENTHSQGMSCLWAAVNHRSVSVARLLVQGGAEAETQFDGVTALMKSIELGEEELFDLLLENGASIANIKVKEHRQPSYDTLTLPVQYAAASGSVHILRQLIKAGLKANESSVRDGWTALYFATRAGHVEIVKTLIHEFGADPIQHANGGTVAIHTAAYHNHVSCIEAFLDAGVDVDIRGRYTRTALSWAAEMGSVDAVRVLLDHGAKISVAGDGESGRRGAMTLMDAVEKRLSTVRERSNYFRELREQDEKKYEAILRMLQNHRKSDDEGVNSSRVR